jgi:hypothetical protein
MITFKIPAGVLAQHVIALGKTRSGKSTAVRVLVEGLLDADKPVCIVDPKGDWWGIKSSADGKKAGYPLVIFGGEHADVPINEHSGAAVAELIATGNRSCLIDLGGWMVGERTRFFVAFASTLFKLARGARHLVIDEVHNFAPQGKILDPDAGKMLHWANRLASEGLGKGIVILAASQRPQKVHKDFLTSCETLIAKQVIHKLDRVAIKDWIDGCADPDKGKEVIATLAQLKKPQAWIWSPEIDYGPTLIEFPLFKTFDSFKPRQENEAPVSGWASVDLDQVKTKLAKVVEDTKANDPAELKKKIAELERQLRKYPDAAVLQKLRDEAAAAAAPVVDPAAVDRAYKDGYDAGASLAVSQGFDKGYAAASAAIAGIVQGVIKAGDDFMVQLRQAATAIAEVPKPEAPAHTGAVVARPRATVTTRPAPGNYPVITREKPRSNGDDSLTGVQRKILDALAELEQIGARSPERELLAFMSGYSHVNSKGFANAMGSLRSAGHIEGTTLTDLGRRHADPPAVPRTPAEIQERIVALLGGASARVLQPLIAAYPRGIERQHLAEAAGYGHVNSKGFANAMGRMRTLGFIDYRGGEVVAKPLLFLE